MHAPPRKLGICGSDYWTRGDGRRESERKESGRREDGRRSEMSWRSEVGTPPNGP